MSFWGGLLQGFAYRNGITGAISAPALLNWFFLFCICDYMFQLYKWPTAYSYLWTLSKINNYATVEKWLLTIFLFPLSPPPSVSTLQFSLASIYLGHQPTYIPNIVLFVFYYNLFRLFFFFLVTVRILVFCYWCFFVSLFFSCFCCFYCCCFCYVSFIVSEVKLFRPPYIVYFFPTVWAHRLWAI